MSYTYFFRSITYFLFITSLTCAEPVYITLIYIWPKKRKENRKKNELPEEKSKIGKCFFLLMVLIKDGNSVVGAQVYSEIFV